MLNGANTISTLNATNTGNGVIQITDTATPLTIASITQSGNGNTTINNMGAISITGTVVMGANNTTSLTSNSTINEFGTGAVTGGTLTTTSVGGTSLGGANTITNFSATNTGSGDVILTDTANLLTIANVNETGTGNVTVSNTGALTTTGPISTTNGNINLNTQNGTETINGTVTANGSGSSVSVATTGTGNLNISTNVIGNSINVNSNGNISQTAGGLITNTLNLTDTGGSTNLTGAGNSIVNLGNVNASGQSINITDNTAAGITQTGEIVAGTVSLSNNLGGVSLTNPSNNIANLGTVTANGILTVVDNSPLGITGALSTTGNPINLTSTSTITETSTGTVSGSTLTTNSATGVALTNPNNNITSFTAINSGLGDIQLADNNSVLTIGSIMQSGAGGSVSLSNSGNVTLTNNLSVGNNNISLSSINGALNTMPATIVVSAAGLTTSSATGTVLGNTNVSNITATNTGNGVINIINNNPNTTTISNITQSGTGAISVQSIGDLNLVGAVAGGNNNISFNSTAGALNESFNGAIITSGTLSASAINGTTLTGENNNFSNFSGINMTSGNLELINTAPLLTIINLGVNNQSTGGNIVVKNTGSIAVNAPISTIIGNISLTTTQGSETINSPITAGGIGGITLSAKSSEGVITFNAPVVSATGSISLNAGLHIANASTFIHTLGSVFLNQNGFSIPLNPIQILSSPTTTPLTIVVQVVGGSNAATQQIATFLAQQPIAARISLTEHAPAISSTVYPNIYLIGDSTDSGLDNTNLNSWIKQTGPVDTSIPSTAHCSGGGAQALSCK
jgi:hypothetical protein